jgi:hypothetical protein
MVPGLDLLLIVADQPSDIDAGPRHPDHPGLARDGHFFWHHLSQARSQPRGECVCVHPGPVKPLKLVFPPVLLKLLLEYRDLVVADSALQLQHFHRRSAGREAFVRLVKHSDATIAVGERLVGDQSSGHPPEYGLLANAQNSSGF